MAPLDPALFSVSRLLEGFARGTLLRPSSSVPNLVDLARALGGCCGVRHSASTAAAMELQGLIGPADTYLLVLVDGLGADVVDTLPAGSFLRAHLTGRLRTVFPATTAAGLTSLATGAWPSEHGVPTWFLFLEEIDATVRPLPYDELATRVPLDRLGLEPDQLFLVPSLAWRYGRGVTGWMPRAIANSTYSSFLLGPGAARGYEHLGEAFDLVERELRGPATVPRYFYLYVPDVDTISHEKGKWHADVMRHLQALDDAVRRFRQRTEGAVRIVLSADHGFQDAPAQRRVPIYRQEGILALLRQPPAGDSRIGIFHVRKGQVGAFCARFSERFGEHFALVSPEQAEELRLFGPDPLAPATRRRLGDVLAIGLGDAILEHVEREKPQAAAHSGLSPQEMEIPLVLA